MTTPNEALPIASFRRRAGAYLIDFILTNGLELAVEYGLAGLVYLVRKFALHETIEFEQAMNPILEQVLSGIFGLGLAYYYYVPYQLKNGTTIGKKVFSIYVVDIQTRQPMTHKQACIRFVGYLPSYLILGCGFIMAAFNPQRRALHDMIAGTICVKKPKELNPV